jgi:ADP-ribose pyrophosphatase YjhB (NUDIX family)
VDELLADAAVREAREDTGLVVEGFGVVNFVFASHVVGGALAASAAHPEVRSFEPQHWGVVEALIRDPDGRNVSLQAPIPEGVVAPDADTHHHEKYGTT